MTLPKRDYDESNPQCVCRSTLDRAEVWWETFALAKLPAVWDWFCPRCGAWIWEDETRQLSNVEMDALRSAFETEAKQRAWAARRKPPVKTKRARH